MLSRLLVPDTLNYMIAGYLVLAVVLSLYLLNIFMRWRKVQAEYQDFTAEEEN